MATEPIDRAYEVLAGKDRILVFTGAGISTESGIPDFRGPEGLWTKLDPDDFTIQRWFSNPELRKQRWRMHAEGLHWGARSRAQPNRGHRAIADLHRAGLLAGVVTQNVDGLHGKSGIPGELLAEVHGSVRTASCLDCGRQWPTEEVLQRVDAGDDDPHCPDCDGLIKTDVVMFGEAMPVHEMDKAWQFFSAADSILVVGSTVSVWPAAEVVVRAAHKALPIVIVNMGPTDADRFAAVKIDAPAGEILPELVARLTTRPTIPS